MAPRECWKRLCSAAGNTQRADCSCGTRRRRCIQGESMRACSVASPGTPSGRVYRMYWWMGSAMRPRPWYVSMPFTTRAYTLPPGILLLVVRLEGSRLDRLPPGRLGPVPLDRGLERRRERVGRSPAEAVDLAAVELVAPCVARAVGDGGYVGLGLAQQIEDRARQRHVLDLVAAADIVDLPRLPLAEDEVDGRAVVEDVEPVAHVPAVAVERHRPVLQRIGDEERDDLLGVLVGAEVVAAPRDDHGQTVGEPVGPRQEVGGRLGRRVGVRGVEPVRLARGAHGDAAVDLVGADQEETGQPALPRGLEERVGAEDVGAQEVV